jgi:radical SAM superfamily enzyme YgiQ (UPF0313 family)
MHHSLIFNCHTQWHSRPGGSYRIATLLREQGWDSEVCEWAPFWTQNELREYAKERISKDTVFLGFSCFFCYWDKNLEEFAAWVKQEYPHVKIILGMMGKPRIESKSCDYFVYGFGENALLAIVASLTGNTPGSGIKLDPGYLARGKKVVNANDFYPSFPMKSLMIRYENRDYLDPSEWLTVEFSRGCMFECLYCNFPVLGVKGDYTRDSDDYVEQLRDAYDRFGITNYYVSDETFNDRTDKIIKFADANDKLPFRPTMSGFLRADLMVAREQDWDPMIRLGLAGHFYGVESFNHKTAKTIGKGMHPDRLKDGLLKIKDYFKSHDRKLYRGLIAMIVGLPYETKQSMEDSRQWIINNWAEESVDWTPLEIPVDEYYDKSSKLSRDWEKWGYKNKVSQLEKVDNEWVMVMHSMKNMNWENEHMDLDWARKWASDYYNDPDIKKPGLHNFLLHWAPGVGITDINDIFNLKQNEAFKLGVDVSFFDKLQKYKSKKLNVLVESLEVIKDFGKFNGTYGNENPWDLEV